MLNFIKKSLFTLIIGAIALLGASFEVDAQRNRSKNQEKRAEQRQERNKDQRQNPPGLINKDAMIRNVNLDNKEITIKNVRLSNKDRISRDEITMIRREGNVKSNNNSKDVRKKTVIVKTARLNNVNNNRGKSKIGLIRDDSGKIVTDKIARFKNVNADNKSNANAMRKIVVGNRTKTKDVRKMIVTDNKINVVQ